LPERRAKESYLGNEKSPGASPIEKASYEKANSSSCHIAVKPTACNSFP